MEWITTISMCHIDRNILRLWQTGCNLLACQANVVKDSQILLHWSMIKRFQTNASDSSLLKWRESRRNWLYQMTHKKMWTAKARENHHWSWATMLTTAPTMPQWTPFPILSSPILTLLRIFLKLTKSQRLRTLSQIQIRSLNKQVTTQRVLDTSWVKTMNSSRRLTIKPSPTGA